MGDAAVGVRSSNASEVAAYSHWINDRLAGDADLAKVLPLAVGDQPGSGVDLFRAFENGLLLAKLVNSVCPGTVDEAMLNKAPKSKLQMMENHNRSLEGARQIGINLTNIGGADLMHGNQTLVLGVTWQIIKAALFLAVGRDGLQLKYASSVNLRSGSGSNVALGNSAGLGSGSLSGVASPPPLRALVAKRAEKHEKENHLLAWVNHTLALVQCPLTVRNFTTDLASGEAYAYLLHAVAPELVTDIVLHEYLLEVATPETRAHRVLQYGKQAGVSEFLSPADIAQGNKNLNMGYVALLYNAFALGDLPSTPAPMAESVPPAKASQDTVELLARIELLEQANSSLQEQLAQAAETNLAQRRASESLGDVVQLQHEVRMLRAQLDGRRGSRDNLQEANSALENELQSLRRTHEEAQRRWEEQAAQHQSELAERERQIFAQRTATESTQDSAAAAEHEMQIKVQGALGRIAELSAEVQRGRETEAQLRTRLQAASEQVGELETAQHDLAAELQRSERNVAQQMRRVASLEQLAATSVKKSQHDSLSSKTALQSRAREREARLVELMQSWAARLRTAAVRAGARQAVETAVAAATSSDQSSMFSLGSRPGDDASDDSTSLQQVVCGESEAVVGVVERLLVELHVGNKELSEKVRARDEFRYRLHHVLDISAESGADDDERVFRQVREWEDTLDEVGRRVEIALLDLGNVAQSVFVRGSTAALSAGQLAQSTSMASLAESAVVARRRRAFGDRVSDLLGRAQQLLQQLQHVRTGLRDGQSREEYARDALVSLNKQVEVLRVGIAARCCDAAVALPGDATVANVNIDATEDAAVDQLVMDTNSRLASVTLMARALADKAREADERLQAARLGDAAIERELQAAATLKGHVTQIRQRVTSLGLSRREPVDRGRVESVMGPEARTGVEALLKLLGNTIQRLQEPERAASSPASGSTRVAQAYGEVFELVFHTLLGLVTDSVGRRVELETALAHSREADESAATLGRLVATVHKCAVAYAAAGPAADIAAVRAAASHASKAAQKEAEERAGSAAPVLRIVQQLLDAVETLAGGSACASPGGTVPGESLSAQGANAGAAAAMQQSVVALLERIANSYAHRSVSVETALADAQTADGILAQVPGASATQDLLQTKKDAQLQTTVFRSAVASLATVSLTGRSGNAGSSLAAFSEQLTAVLARFDSLVLVYQRLQGQLDGQLAGFATVAGELAHAIESARRQMAALGAVSSTIVAQDATTTPPATLVGLLDTVSQLVSWAGGLQCAADELRSETAQSRTRSAAERECLVRLDAFLGDEVDQLQHLLREAAVSPTSNGATDAQLCEVANTMQERVELFVRETPSAAPELQSVCTRIQALARVAATGLERAQHAGVAAATAARRTLDAEVASRRDMEQVRENYERRLRSCVDEINELVATHEKSDAGHRALVERFNAEHIVELEGLRQAVDERNQALGQAARADEALQGLVERLQAQVSLYETSLADHHATPSSIPLLAGQAVHVGESALGAAPQLDTVGNSSAVASLGGTVQRVYQALAATLTLLHRYDALTGAAETRADGADRQIGTLKTQLREQRAQAEASSRATALRESEVAQQLQGLCEQLGLAAQGSASERIQAIARAATLVHSELVRARDSMVDTERELAALDPTIDSDNNPRIGIEEVTEITRVAHQVTTRVKQQAELLVARAQRCVQLSSRAALAEDHLATKEDEVSAFEAMVERVTTGMSQVRADLGEVREQKVDLLHCLTRVQFEQDRIVQVCDHLHQTIAAKLAAAPRLRQSSAHSSASSTNSAGAASHDDTHSNSSASVNRLEASVESMLAAFHDQSAAVQAMVAEMVQVSQDLDQVKHNYASETAQSRNQLSSVLGAVARLDAELAAARGELGDGVRRNKERTRVLRSLLQLVRRMAPVFPVAEKFSELRGGLAVEADGAPSVNGLEALLRFLQLLFDSALASKESFTRQVTVLTASVGARDESDRSLHGALERLAGRVGRVLQDLQPAGGAAVPEAPLGELAGGLAASVMNGLDQDATAALLLGASTERARLTTATAVDEDAGERRFDLATAVEQLDGTLERVWELMHSANSQSGLRVQELQSQLRESAQTDRRCGNTLIEAAVRWVSRLAPGDEQVVARWRAVRNAGVTAALQRIVPDMEQPIAALSEAQSRRSASLLALQQQHSSLKSEFAELRGLARQGLDTITGNVSSVRQRISVAVNASRHRSIGYMNERNRALWELETAREQRQTRSQLETKFNEELSFMQSFLQARLRSLELFVEQDGAQQLIQQGRLITSREDAAMVSLQVLDWTPQAVSDTAEALGAQLQALEARLTDHYRGYRQLQTVCRDAQQRLGQLERSEASARGKVNQLTKSLVTGLAQARIGLQDSSVNDTSSSATLVASSVALVQGPAEEDQPKVAELLADLESGVRVSRQRRADLEHQLAARTRHGNQLEKDLKELTEEHLRTTEELAQVASERTELAAKLGAVSRRAEQLAVDNGATAQRLRETTAARAQLHERAVALEHEHETLEKRVVVLEDECRTLLAEKQSLRAHVQSLEASLVDQGRLVAELEGMHRSLHLARTATIAATDSAGVICADLAAAIVPIRASLARVLPEGASPSTAETLESMTLEERGGYLRGELLLVGELLHTLFERLDGASRTAGALAADEQQLVATCARMSHGIGLIARYMYSAHPADNVESTETAENVRGPSQGGWERIRRTFAALTSDFDQDELVETQAVAGAVDDLRAALGRMVIALNTVTEWEPDEKAVDLRARLATVQTVASQCRAVLLDGSGSAPNLAPGASEDALGVLDPARIPFKSTEHLGFVPESRIVDVLGHVLLQVHHAMHPDAVELAAVPADEPDDEQAAPPDLGVLSTVDKNVAELKSRIASLARDRMRWVRRCQVRQARIVNLEAFISFIQAVRAKFGPDAAPSAYSASATALLARLERLKHELGHLRGLVADARRQSAQDLDTGLELEQQRAQSLRSLAASLSNVGPLKPVLNVMTSGVSL